MVAGIERYLRRATENAVARRARHWARETTAPETYSASVAPNRERLRLLLGVTEPRLPAAMHLVVPVGAETETGRVGEGYGFRVELVRWAVLPGVDGEGLLLTPTKPARAAVVAIPDCSWSPEMLVGLVPGVPAAAQYARRLAENGCRVLVPTLVDRGSDFSGYAKVRTIAISQREFIYRAAYEMGSHIIGFEVQKVLAGVDWFKSQGPGPVGVIGGGDGGLLALYSAAVDTRIDAAAVLGYFQPREELWREPIDRNVWARLEEFGDAELAGLVVPRPLLIETCQAPEWTGRPPSATGQGPTPGEIRTPSLTRVKREFERTRELVAGLKPPPPLHLFGDGTGQPGADGTLMAFLDACGGGLFLAPAWDPPQATGPLPDARARMQRQVEQLVRHTQTLVEDGERRREAFWAKTADAKTPEAWQDCCREYRDYFWQQVIGKLPPPALPANPRSRLLYEERAYTAYEVVLDVYPDVFVYGILLLPRDLRPDERRPVVVCQHGLEGRPQDVAVPKDHPAYRMFGCQLAERGFVVFAPQNPYIGYDCFRVLQRQANPLRLSLFSFIVRQHQRLLEWLGDQPFVDRERIGFYGISYGGKTAMRVPAILEGYALSVCSADFNEWVRKNADVTYRASYLYSHEYEMFEFDLGRTLNYAEMSWLICPRPFMVERGHHDGVGVDEWVGYEYAKSFRRYSLLGLADRCRIEWFDGPHAINGKGAFAFLHHWLKWPAPEPRAAQAVASQEAPAEPVAPAG